MSGHATLRIWGAWMKAVQIWCAVVLVSGLLLATNGCRPAALSQPTSPTATPTLTTPGRPVPTKTPIPTMSAAPGGMVLYSSSFEPGGYISDAHTCFGPNVSPSLTWAAVPERARSLVLIVEDPDSDPPGFLHWLVYNIPPDSTGLPEDVPAGEVLENGALQGVNDFAQYGMETFPGGAPVKRVGYDGPCPPTEHQYLFTLYALDSMLGVLPGGTRQQVLSAMRGHILAQATMVGIYRPPSELPVPADE